MQKTKRFIMNKLVRDKMLPLFEKEGSVPTYTYLKDDNDYLDALTQKLIEELQEVFSSEDLDELIAELADFEEALTEFKQLLKIDLKQLETVKEQKRKERGTYGGRLFLEALDVPLANKERIEYYEQELERSMPAFDLSDLDLEDDEDDEGDEE